MERVAAPAQSELCERLNESMTEDIKRLYHQTFGHPPTHFVQAPGRLELLGNHTDYNQGWVMSIAVDRYLGMAAGPRSDGKIALASSASPEREVFYSDKIEKNPSAPWTNYIKGVLLQLRQRGVHFTGFNAAIHSTLPIGAGMSSSAALEVATALIIRKLFPYSISETHLCPLSTSRREGGLAPLDKAEMFALAKVCQAAEREFVGANVGLLDQVSCLYGRAGHVMQIDFQHLSVTHEPMPPDLSVVMCDSGVKHDLAATGGYNELRQHCESAARNLGVPSLRALDLEVLQASRAKLSQREYACAYHIVGENYRVLAGERALRSGDVDQFGQYLYQSHASSRDYFKNSCRELDILVDLASQHSGCIGARLSGGGFGGATINLVRRSCVREFATAIAKDYQQQTGIELNPLVCSIVDGAR